MNMKEILIGVATVVIALVIYDLAVKKLFKISSFEDSLEAVTGGN